MRHVLIKVGYQTNQVMVVFVMAEPDFKGRKIMFAKLIEKYPQVKTIIIDVNTRSSSAVLSGKQKTYVGNGYIEDKLLGYTFKISASSFFQVNPRQTEKLYGKAIEYAQLTGTERVLDVYSGTGTIGILLSKKAKEVVCVESNRWAVEDAKVNAQLNKINNVKMVLADATEYMIRAAEQGLSFDVVVMDPPRSGATPEFLKALKQLKPKRIVYISCEPKTQADDVKQLISDYSVESIQPVDMFPYTRHVETVVLMSKR
jgi:23S rRNA (uracil1939-C5)-methyltransferase